MINSFNDPRTPIPDSRNGIVLIVVLGTLALMSILALTFVTMTRLERSISANYVDHTRAVFTAESGIEAAIAQLSQFKGGVLPAAESEHMQYNPDDPTVGLDKATKLSFMSPVTGPGDRPCSGVVDGTYVASGDYFLLKVEDESGKLNLNDSNELMNPSCQTGRRLFSMVDNLVEILYAADRGAGIGLATAIEIFSERKKLGGKFSMLSQVEDVLKSLDFTTQECRQFLSNVTLWSWQDPDVIKPIPAFGSFNNALDLYGNPDPVTGFPRYGFPFMRWEEVQSFNDGDNGNGIHDRGYQLEPRCPVNVNTASKELIQALLADLEGWTLFEGPGEKYVKYPMDADVGSGEEPLYYYGHWMSMGLNGEKGARYYSNFRYENTPRTSDLLREAADKIELDAITTNVSHDFRKLTLPYARLRRTRVPDLDPNNNDGDPKFSAELANDLYARIHGLGIYVAPDPIENWREFEFYLDSVIQRAKGGGLPDLAINDPFAADESEATWTYDRGGDFQYFNEYYRDLILANFDPNTMTNDFNPDQVVYRHTDKADLITYTTEFSFEPTGAFCIESLGRVLESGDGNQTQAEQSIAAIVKIFEFKRLTTQAQLVGNDTSTAILSDNFGRNESANATKWGDVVGYDNGARLVSHPEPVLTSLPDHFEFIKNCIFDGRIGLASIKHNTDGILEGVSSPASLWSYYEGSMNAFNPGGTVSPGLPSELQTHLKYQINNSYYNPIMVDFEIAEELRESENALMAAHSTDSVNRKPGTLFVDGVFSEAWKCPAYPLSANDESHISKDMDVHDTLMFEDVNVEGGRQTLVLALKPGFLMKDSNRCRNFFNMGQASGWLWPYIGSMLSISRLQVNLAPWNAGGLEVWQEIPENERQHPISFGCSAGVSCRSRAGILPRTNFVRTDNDPDRTYQAFGRSAYHFEGHRWNLIAASWGFQEGVFQLSINGLSMDPTYCKLGNFENMATMAVPFTIIRKVRMPMFEDYSSPDQPFKAPIRLGTFSRAQGFGCHLLDPADSTYGEFVLYKDSIDSEASFQRIGDFFRDEGFYYHDPGEPAAYTTPEINLGAKVGKPVTIRSISWTGHWPQYVCADDVAPAEDLDPQWGSPDYAMPIWMDKNSDGRFDMLCLDDDLKHPRYWDPFTVDIFANDCWLYADNGPGCWNLTPPETRLSYPGGSVPYDTDGWKLKTDDPIRLKFYFNLADSQVEPLRESPYLDDITITYVPAQGVKVLYYQMY
ncbi:PilX N-terminal domain-containing pilus assembly protein [Planctomycetota bacterium]